MERLKIFLLNLLTKGRHDAYGMKTIRQILMLNAGQSIPDGGGLTISTENCLLSKEGVIPYDMAAGPYVKLSVADTGTEMDENTLQRIFEPFFTTKAKGRGTCLGLAMV